MDDGREDIDTAGLSLIGVVVVAVSKFRLFLFDNVSIKEDNVLPRTWCDVNSNKLVSPFAIIDGEGYKETEGWIWLDGYGYSTVEGIADDGNVCGAGDKQNKTLNNKNINKNWK